MESWIHTNDLWDKSKVLLTELDCLASQKLSLFHSIELKLMESLLSKVNIDCETELCPRMKEQEKEKEMRMERNAMKSNSWNWWSGERGQGMWKEWII
jgi:hypothetical protein